MKKTYKKIISIILSVIILISVSSTAFPSAIAEIETYKYNVGEEYFEY